MQIILLLVSLPKVTSQFLITRSGLRVKNIAEKDVLPVHLTM